MFFSSGQKQVWMKNRVRKRKKSGKKRKGRKQISNKRQLAITILFLAVFISILHSSFLWKPNSVSGISPKQEEGSDVGSRVLPAEDGPCGRPEITEDFLDKNPYSRRNCFKEGKGSRYPLCGKSGQYGKRESGLF